MTEHYVSAVLKKAVPLWARDGVAEWSYFPIIWWLEWDDREAIMDYLSDPKRLDPVAAMYKEIDGSECSAPWDAYERLERLQENIAAQTCVPKSVVGRTLWEAYRRVTKQDHRWWLE